jgi:SHS2 domain-containing protein
MKYEFFRHTADVKFKAYGKTLDEAYANAAEAMFSVMMDITKVKPVIEKKITVSGADDKALLYNFLEEFLFLLDSESFFLHQVKSVKINGKELVAVIIGDAASDAYEAHGDVKAVTYNEMEIHKDVGNCFVQVVLDV